MTTESAAPAMLHGWAIYLRAGSEARRRGYRRSGTDHLLLALFEDPSLEAVLGVSLQQARQALESLDREALGALGLGSGADAPALKMHAEGPIEFRSTVMPFASALLALISIVIPVDPEHRCPPGVMLILVAMKAKATDGLKPTHSRCISLSIFGDVRWQAHQLASSSSPSSAYISSSASSSGP